MNSECTRIADQLRRAFTGDPWHGPALYELLSGIPPEQASHRPFPPAHSIWELVLHIDTDLLLAAGAMEGIPMPTLFGTELDWPAVSNITASAWEGTLSSLFQHAATLADAIEHWTDHRLRDVVPGRDYDFYRLFHGVVQHGLYHGGQIALLRKIPGPGNLA
jgi:hypothetical protein